MAEKIIKKGVDDVEVTVSSTVKSINDIEFEVWGSTHTYGQDRIDAELASAQQSLTDANALDEVAYKQKLKDNGQAKISFLQRIQTEMDK